MMCLAVLCLAASVSQGATLLLRYNFDEAASGNTNALDTGIAPAADGTLVDGATRTNNTPGGESPGALDLTDTNTTFRYVTAGDVAKLDGLTNFTLTCWLNLQADPTGVPGVSSSNRRLLAKQAASSFNGFSWNMNASLGNYSADNFTVGLFVGGEGGFSFGVGDATTGASNRWVFLAVTYDGTTNLDNVKFYVGDETNAVTQLGSTMSISAGTTLDDVAAFTVGHTDAAPVVDTAPPGWMDDTRVYDDVLDTNELDAVRLENLPPTALVQLMNPAFSGNTFSFSFETQAASTHTVQFRNAVDTGAWQVLTTIAGDGSVTNVSDTTATNSSRYYRVETD